MNLGELNAIRHFIARFRRKIWLRGLQSVMLYAGGCGAAILLIAGAVNLLFHPLPMTFALGIAALPLLMGFGMSLVKFRPNAESAAMAADSLFAGKSLMTTALGLIGGKQTAASPISEYTVHCAAKAAVDWNNRIDELPKNDLGLAYWMVAGIALAGLFLLIQRGSVNASAFAADVKRQSQAEHRPEDPASLMAKIAAAGNPQSTQTERVHPDVPQSPEEALEQNAYQADAKDGKFKAERDFGDKRNHDRLSVSPSSSQGEGVGALADSSKLGKPAIGIANFDERFLDITRHGGDATNRPALPFNKRKTQTSASAPGNPPSAPVSSVGKPSFSRFSKAQRLYVDAYLKRIGTR